MAFPFLPLVIWHLTPLILQEIMDLQTSATVAPENLLLTTSVSYPMPVCI